MGIFAIPSLIFWAIGIPNFAIYLYQTREDLKNHFGWIFIGYKKKKSFWEIVIMYRKVSIIASAILLKQASTELQLLFTFFVIVFFLLL